MFSRFVDFYRTCGGGADQSDIASWVLAVGNGTAPMRAIGTDPIQNCKKIPSDMLWFRLVMIPEEKSAHRYTVTWLRLHINQKTFKIVLLSLLPTNQLMYFIQPCYPLKMAQCR